jgi:hypothetical protein
MPSARPLAIALALAAPTLAAAPVAVGQSAERPTLSAAGYRALEDSTALSRRLARDAQRAATTPSLRDDRRVLDRAVRDCRRLGGRVNVEVRLQRDSCATSARATRSFTLALNSCLRRARDAVACLTRALTTFAGRQERATATIRRLADRLAEGPCRSLLIQSAEFGEASVATARRLTTAIRRGDQSAVQAQADALRRQARRGDRFTRGFARRQRACAPPSGSA